MKKIGKINEKDFSDIKIRLKNLIGWFLPSMKRGTIPKENCNYILHKRIKEVKI